jgi:hypothetical protein
MESTFGNGSFNGACRVPGVSLVADGKTRLLVSIEGAVCCSGAGLSVDDGVGSADCDWRSADDVTGAAFDGAGSTGNGIDGRGTVGEGPATSRGFVGGPVLTDRTVDTGFASFFTAGACGTGFGSLRVADGGGTGLGSALADVCAGRVEALRWATGIGLAGEAVNTFQYE